MVKMDEKKSPTPIMSDFQRFGDVFKFIMFIMFVWFYHSWLNSEGICNHFWIYDCMKITSQLAADIPQTFVRPKNSFVFFLF